MAKPFAGKEVVVVIAAIASCVLVVGVLLLWAGQSDLRKFVNNPKNLCDKRVEKLREDLDKVHCGKACLRSPVEYTYWCGVEKKTVIFIE